MTSSDRERTIANLRWRLQRQPADVPFMATLAEVSALMRVSSKTVTSWTKNGRLPCVRTLGGHRRIPWAAVERLLKLNDIEVPK